MPNIYEIKDLLIRRSGLKVLEIDALDIFEGEILAVIGPNGAGKSTLLLTLSRLLKPDRGQVNFKGQSIQSMDDLTYRRKLALVLQEPLLLNRSVSDNVAVGLRFRGLDREEVNQRVKYWLERFGVLPLKDRQAQRLSGGEAQRVSLARAFALQPEVLLLDEPFGSLDAPTRAALLGDLHRTLSEVDFTTIFITHDLNEALSLGDRVAVLLDGRLRQTGPPEQVFATPADQEVAAFVGVETILPGRVISNHAGGLVVDVRGRQLEAIGALDSGQDVYFCLRPEDITLWPVDDIPHSSARNRISGKILEFRPQGPLVQVVIDCGFPLVALITRASKDEMGLVEGQPVIASFKASAVHLIER
jgi:tungstate transport system ATP-binding protein